MTYESPVSSPWPLAEVDESAVKRLAQEAGVSEILARLLWRRGITDATEARHWLHPTIDHLHPPELLPDFHLAVARLRQALAGQEPILLWGHDDLDGVTATAVLYRILSDLQAKVRYHIPEKGKERHGLTAGSVLSQDGVRLVVTVDCGVTNRQAVEVLKRRGVDVVVTDHHEVIEPLPEAVANVDPKRPDSRYPYRGLAGVGVALKLGMGLVQELLGISPREFLTVQPDATALAVLGTIADRVPLTGENRTLVVIGLRALEQSRLPALRAVLETLNPENSQLTIQRFVADLLPLFAAANGNEGVRHFLNAELDEARSWVSQLAAKSREWRADAERTFELAQEVLRKGDGILFAQSKEFSLRALGSTAARLKERYQVPAVVMGWRGDAWVGECRGTDSVNMLELLRAHRHYFLDYGGHKRACGFSIADDKVEEFILKAERFAHENFVGRLLPERPPEADAFLPISRFSSDLLRLAPFGEGNPQPMLVSGPNTFLPSGSGWVCDERPDLILQSADRKLEPGVPAWALWTFDDLGRLTILDFRPAPKNRP
ncbi:MAG: DHH family phosphoesterase [candidate division WOR-3 bacterium]